MNKYWCCYIEGIKTKDGAFKYQTEKDAIMEARRLAELHRGKPVYVLKVLEDREMKYG